MRAECRIIHRKRRRLIRLPAELAIAASLFLAPALAQEYIISTVAGGSPPPTPALATSISIFPPSGLAVDSQGNAYFSSNNCIFKLDRSGIVTRVAGNARPGFSGDGGPALSAQINNPTNVAVDRSGNIYFLDSSNHRIRRISPEGVITTFAGSGRTWDLNPPEDGLPAPDTPLPYVLGLAVDSTGNVYYIDAAYMIACRIRKVSRSGLVTTVAGGGSGAPDDGSHATSVRLENVKGIAVDGRGNLFFSVGSTSESRVRKVDAEGILSTAAGAGPPGVSGDRGPKLAAQLNDPGALSVDDAGNLFIADRGNYRVRKVSLDGAISTVAGGGRAWPGDQKPATQVAFCLDERCLSALATDNEGNLYIAACWIQKVSPDGILSNLSGNGKYNIGGDGGPAVSAQLFGPTDLALDRAGNLYIADMGNNRIRKLTRDGIIQTVAGTGENAFGGDGGPATQALLNAPGSVAVDSEGALYISDCFNFRIRKVALDGQITTVAGTGSMGFSPDGTPALHADILPGMLAFDNYGNLLFVDGSRIRKVDDQGFITTIAGNGKSGFAGDGGAATQASFYGVGSLAVDKSDNVLFTDVVNNRIRKVSPDGIISTIAGVAVSSVPMYADRGDAGPATEAIVLWPLGLAVDESGNIFLSDLSGMRRITPHGLIHRISTVTVPTQSMGDGGPVSHAHLNPRAMKIGEAGQIYVVDARTVNVPAHGTPDASIRRLDPTSETVILTTVRDGATQSARPISPGKVVVLDGVGMGPPQILENSPYLGSYSTKFAGTEVLVDGVPAEILYTSSTRVSAVIPRTITGPLAQIVVRHNGVASQPISVAVEPSSPGIFSANETGAGQAAAFNPDGSRNGASRPVKPGESLILLITGEGSTPPEDSELSVTIGGRPAKAHPVAPQDPRPGVLNILVQVPSGVEASGYVPVSVQIRGASSPPGASWIAVAESNP